MVATNAANAPIVDSASTGRPSRSTGRIGAASPRSRRTKRTPTRTPTATIAAETTGLSPCTALSSPPITRPNIPAHITAPSTSKRVSRPATSGSERPSARLTSANGTALANTQGQGAIARIRPPSVGARAAELDTTTELMPSPRPSCRAG